MLDRNEQEWQEYDAKINDDILTVQLQCRKRKKVKKIGTFSLNIVTQPLFTFWRRIVEK